MIRVAVDAMGGDKAPQAEIAGVLQALASLPGDYVVQLVGRTDVIEAELARHADVDRQRLEIWEAQAWETYLAAPTVVEVLEAAG